LIEPSVKSSVVFPENQVSIEENNFNGSGNLTLMNGGKLGIG
ncbi:unnamed protein product, partial [marine sediment metagenome]